MSISLLDSRAAALVRPVSARRDSVDIAPIGQNDGIHLANGLAFSLDYRTLYFTDSAARRIYAYDYDPLTGETRNRRVLVQLQNNEGLPDGLTVDAEGFLWSAQWYGSCVIRYDPDGKFERCDPQSHSFIYLRSPPLFRRQDLLYWHVGGKH